MNNQILESSRISSILRYFLPIISFNLSTFVLVYFDVPVLGQICGFILLTFVPGLLIIHVLKLNNIKPIDKFVLSIGLSIFFVMFAGLLINTLYPLFGLTPLTSKSAIVSLCTIILILTVIACLRNRTISFFKYPELKLNIKDKIYLLLPAILPLISIIGMRLMNNADNNLILIILLLLIPIYIVFIAIFHKNISEKIYPPLIFLVGISLVLLLALRSNHIIGADIHTEYYVFQKTLENGRWQILLDGTLDSCLSISILPSVYLSFVNINSEYLFKILYPLLFSFSPLVIFLICRKYLNSFYSFFAAIFFMSQWYFLNAEYSPRTVIAILFFALVILVLFQNQISSSQKRLLFIIFTASCVVSHYSTTYIYFIVLVITWIVTLVTDSFQLILHYLGLKSEKKSLIYVSSRNNISFESIIILFLMIFIWYGVVVGATFNDGFHFFYTTLRNIQNFFDMGSRGNAATVLGSGVLNKPVPGVLNLLFFWITAIFIATGLLISISKYRQLLTHNQTKFETQNFPVKQFDPEFLFLSIACSAILVAAIALPYVLVGYDMDRTYIQMMAVLSPFYAIGGLIFAKMLHIRLAYIIILISLIPYFLCSNGIIYQMYGIPMNIILNSKGLNYDITYVHAQEVYASEWLSKRTKNNSLIYSDYGGTVRLVSQGGIISAIYAQELIEKSQPLEKDGYFYLRYKGFLEGKIMDKNQRLHDIREYYDYFNPKNLIYSNGGSGIYK
jgi:uncharacterized membrane protein